MVKQSETNDELYQEELTEYAKYKAENKVQVQEWREQMAEEREIMAEQRALNVRLSALLDEWEAK